MPTTKKLTSATETILGMISDVHRLSASIDDNGTLTLTIATRGFIAGKGAQWITNRNSFIPVPPDVAAAFADFLARAR